MNAIYEYIMAALMMFVMLVTLHTNMQSLITDTSALITQEEYRMAESLIDIILLSPGNPSNWSLTDPVLFGLATQETTGTYSLDPKKVLRLDENCTEYPFLSPGKLRSLLGLTSDINLVIRITPILIIEIQPQGGRIYKIVVTNHRGVPTANINVTGYYVPESLGSGDQAQQQSITGIDGSCILDFSAFEPPPLVNYALVVCADLIGVKTMRTDPPYLNVRIEGGKVVQSEVPLINCIDYSSGSFYGLNTDWAARYVEIDGFTYYFELEIWR
jgi:hypothetical protein